MKKFTPNEAIKFGWQTTKKNFWFFFVLLIIIWASQIIPTGIANAFKEKIVVIYILFTLAAWFVQMLVKIGTIRVMLDILDKGKSEYAALFSQIHLFWKFLLGGIIYALIVLGGFLLLIVPGIIWAIKYQFYSYLIIDKNLSPMEAIKKSGEITMGNKGSLFLLGILLALINILGAMCLLIGLFATIPLSMVAMTFVYRKLIADPTAAETVATPSSIPAPQTQQPA